MTTRTRGLAPAAVFAFAVAGLPLAAQAATFTVDSTFDDFDAAPGDGSCATAGAICTLRAAINEANALAGDDHIIVPAGTFLLALGELVVIDTLTVVAAGTANTIVDGRNLSRVLHVYVPAGLTLADLTITNGTAGDGGGILNQGGTVNIARVTLTSNTASSGSGGGLYSEGGTVTLSDTVLSNNQAGNTGGGLGQLGGTMTLVGCTVVANSATNGGGGIQGGNSLHVTASLVADNTAPFGAGIASGTTTVITASTVSGNDAFVTGGGIVNGGGSVTVVGSAISGNAAAYDGAGIFNQAGANLTLHDTTVRDNHAGQFGGGINTWGSANLERVTLSGNSAAQGGGVYEGQGDLSLTNVTLSGNIAASGGGVFHLGGTLTVNNGTVTANAATGGNGGGLGGGGSVTIRNTIVAGNFDGGGEAPDCSLDVISAGYNLVGTTAGCNFAPDVGDQTEVAPALRPLRNYGGPTATHALLAGSPALDAGNPAGCTGRGGSPLTTDQRGFARPLDGGTGVVRCDVGAFEVDPSDIIFADGFE